MMYSVAIETTPTSRLLFCGYSYVEMPVDGRQDYGRRGGPRWLRLNLVRGMWAGDRHLLTPVPFRALEDARAQAAELRLTHEPLADRLIIVDAVTGDRVECGADA